jgi:hypothetical protein
MNLVLPSGPAQAPVLPMFMGTEVKPPRRPPAKKKPAKKKPAKKK